MSFKTYLPVPLELCRIARCKNCTHWKPSRPREKAYAGGCAREREVLVSYAHGCASWQAMPCAVA